MNAVKPPKKQMRPPPTYMKIPEPTNTDTAVFFAVFVFVVLVGLLIAGWVDAYQTNPDFQQTRHYQQND